METTFIWRVVRSGFGLRGLSNKLHLAQHKKKVLSMIAQGGSMTKRRDVYALLGVSVLLGDPEVSWQKRHYTKETNIIYPKSK